ncbi:wall-associated receptor kinase-like 16 [Pyrus ussuriensis x Pyrus communis]|uniref:Wall-associated receptor kinase-like 16 n=1 Tax=Pyrus ussuriensis x Pyrus communis TaxID=2448454 RepID=A0A5N5F2B2_9ROSA|nr:wall-associated receptor kinase-like 16 [Pyrus ussuriensis x Pyrus communis]
MKTTTETARALAYFHYWSVIHQDVKTQNILIDLETYTAKVSGFGAPRLLHEEENEVSTLPGKSGSFDPYDVFSFGVVLAELLTSQEVVSFDGPERSLVNVFVCSVQEGCLD